MDRSTNQKAFVFFLTTICFLSSISMGQQIDARISSDQAYVGAPIQLQIRIINPTNYEFPEPPKIADCRSEMVGVPSQSSKITIYNGRRQETRSMTAVYEITPLRPGQFEIPELKVTVDGQTQSLQSYKFTATESKTGDLLFVEIEGKQQEVFVGQPLDISLLIYLKPYRAQNGELVLNESEMWQRISRNTSWGVFEDRMVELNENRTRPGGKRVLRKDASGQESVYYLFRIDATIYPKRPGKIEGESVQLVVDYPVEMGRRRDPLRSMLEESGINQSMFADDFFRSPFGRGNSVSKSRPIVASASVDATKVIPVPLQGKPADYRGAIGKYQIVTDAEPKNVTAGDPITLRLAIVGDGPLDLLPPPPLSELSLVTDNFKTEDQALAGFTQNQAKIFVTTIRPRKSGITSIPGIPFSYFDPDLKEYKTVVSEPIDITVTEAQELSLDSIVGKNNGNRTQQESKKTRTESSTQSNFANQFSESALVSFSSDPIDPNGWNWFLAPMLIFFAICLIRLAGLLPRIAKHLRSAKINAERSLVTARGLSDLRQLLMEFIHQRFTIDGRISVETVVGSLRLANHYRLAAEVESFLDLIAKRIRPVSDGELNQLKHSCLDLIERIDLAARSKPDIGPIGHRGNSQKKRYLKFFVIFCVLASQTTFLKSADTTDDTASMTAAQVREVFAQANETYQQARALNAENEESRQMFAVAASRYQLIVDSGIRNPELFLNLGNAQFQSQQFGRAIASYRSGLKLDPYDATITANLKLARKKIDQRSSVPENPQHGTWEYFDTTKRMVARWIRSNLLIIGFLGSLVFWGGLSLRLLGVQIPTIAVPILVLAATICCAAGYLHFFEASSNTQVAIVVSDSLNVHAGDGPEFSVIQTIESAEGMSINILAERHGWSQIITASGQQGWIQSNLIVKV